MSSDGITSGITSSRPTQQHDDNRHGQNNNKFYLSLITVLSNDMNRHEHQMITDMS